MPRPGQLLGFLSRSPAAKAAPGYRPGIEFLEDRFLPSIALPPRIAGEQEGPVEGATDPLDVVTYNVDAGSHLAPLLAASAPQDLPAAMSQVWAEVQASNVPERAAVLAGEILGAHPDVVGIQDAGVWTLNGVPQYDFAQLLQQDLAGLGRRFILAARTAVTVVQLPDAADDQVGYVDQTIVLVNPRVRGRGFRLAHPAGGIFNAHREAQAGGPQGMVLPLVGTWASVLLVNPGHSEHTIRFVTAHLDSADATVNAAQVSELLAGPANTWLPVVLAGDFGAPPGSPGADAAMLQAGFNDIWHVKYGDQPGFTSAQPDLHDPNRDLQARADQVFFQAGQDMNAVSVSLLGTGLTDRTPSGLWPSDHAGLHARMLFP
jgi:hypothetical protein